MVSCLLRVGHRIMSPLALLAPAAVVEYHRKKLSTLTYFII